MSLVATQVAAFHSRLPGDTPQVRDKLTKEEGEELLEALESGDRVAIARELADVVYVAYGTALVYGIELDKAISIVHEANMRKFMGPSFRADGKIMKPANWTPPDVSPAVKVEDPRLA